MSSNKENSKHLTAPDLSVESERQRLGPTGLKSVFRIAAKWRLSDAEMLALLSLGSETAIEQLSLNPPSDLFTEERLLRISYLIGIYKGLHIVYGDRLADCWVKLPNQNSLFGGATPLEFMIRGGQDAMRLVRQLMDARCAGQ